MVGAMAVALRVRSGIGALYSSSSLLNATSTQSQQKCGFISKALRETDYKRPAPFPYKTKKYNLFRACFDHVSTRFDENSKIIVIDGPPTGDKTAFAKQVADELDMLHVGPANLDDVYVNEYGFDLRTLNPQLPLSVRSFDVHQFLQNPKHSKVARLQHNMIRIKWQQYVDVIAHVMNTGQGVVMNRSLYSDFIFVDTLVKHGFLSENARKYFNECKENAMFEFMYPHLVIYLDIPVDNVLANVKARNRPHEQNSPFYTKEVLKTMEDIYKKQYLREMSKHSEIMIYDWSEGGEAEVVVEDICRLDIDSKYTLYDTQLENWRFKDEWDMKYKRIMFSHPQFREEMKSWLNVPRFYCEELVISGDDALAYSDLLWNTPGCRHQYGFNKEMGDKYLFKNTFKN